MYSLAGELDPESMRATAARTYSEMAASGYGAVGEFHYVHHRPDGRPYDDPNALAIALAEAGVAAGLTVVLLPAAYHRAGWDDAHLPPTPGQRRFCDPTIEDFVARVDALRAWAARRPHVRVGVAAHSVRAVPAEWLTAIAEYADLHGLVRHVHAAEQRRELSECESEHGCSPVALLERTGFLGERTSVVHGIHVSPRDIELLARSRTIVVSCPTTEGNLGDGHLPALRYRDAGVRLAIGSDSQVRLDPFEEAQRSSRPGRGGRARRATACWQRPVTSGAELVRHGQASLGLEEGQAGSLTVDLEHPDLAGVADEDLELALATLRLFRRWGWQPGAPPDPR